MLIFSFQIANVDWKLPRWISDVVKEKSELLCELKFFEHCSDKQTTTPPCWSRARPPSGIPLPDPASHFSCLSLDRLAWWGGKRRSRRADR